MSRQTDEPAKSNSEPRPEFNPLMNPLLAQNMGRWAEVYYTNPPERREEALLELLRELEAENPAGEATPAAVPDQVPHTAPAAKNDVALFEPPASIELPAKIDSPINMESQSSIAPPSIDPQKIDPQKIESQSNGVSTFVARSETHSASPRCPSCGHQNRAGNFFCGECGGRLDRSGSIAASINARFREPAQRGPSELSGDSIGSQQASSQHRSPEQESSHERSQPADEPPANDDGHAAAHPLAPARNAETLPRSEYFSRSADRHSADLHSADRRSGDRSELRSGPLRSGPLHSEPLHSANAAPDPSLHLKEPARPYRLYIVVAVIVAFLVLVYMAWRGRKSDQPPRRVQSNSTTTQQATSEQTGNSAGVGKPSGIPQSSSGSLQPNDNSPPSSANAAGSSVFGSPSSKAVPEAKVEANVPEVQEPEAQGPEEQRKGTLQKAASTSPAEAPAVRKVPQGARLPGPGSEELSTAQNFLNGTNGQPRDPAQAAPWLWKAVAKENGQATLLLADLYLKGEGVAKNCDQARLLLDAAATKGVPGAGERLRNLRTFGCQ